MYSDGVKGDDGVLNAISRALDFWLPSKRYLYKPLVAQLQNIRE